MYSTTKSIKGTLPGEVCVMKGNVVIAFNLPEDIGETLVDMLTARIAERNRS